LILKIFIPLQEWRVGCPCFGLLEQNNSGGIMGAKFDIFKKLPDGNPLWVKAVEGLEEAKAQLARLMATAPGEYFIYSVRNGRIIHPNMAHQA
jgi:hypothetical protein